MALNPPIYDQLLQEHGDVVSEAREAADQAHRQAENVLGWSRPIPQAEGGSRGTFAG